MPSAVLFKMAGKLATST